MSYKTHNDAIFGTIIVDRIVPPVGGSGPGNTNIIPALDNTYDIGSSTFRWRDGYFGNDLTVDGDLISNGSAVLGNNSSDFLTVNATATFNPAATFTAGLTANANVSLGSSSRINYTKASNQTQTGSLSTTVAAPITPGQAGFVSTIANPNLAAGASAIFTVNTTPFTGTSYVFLQLSQPQFVIISLFGLGVNSFDVRLYNASSGTINIAIQFYYFRI